jgi:pilus assembly protein CpaE
MEARSGLSMSDASAISEAHGRSDGAAPGAVSSPAEQSVRVVALVKSAEAEEALKEAIAAGQSGARLRTAIAPRLELATLYGLESDVVFLEVDVGDPKELQVLAEFVADRATAPVVVTSPRLDVAAMREFMRIGVNDVVPQPFDPGELAEALRQAMARRPAAPAKVSGERGLVIGFISSGGGVGVTSLVVQGACALARRKGMERLCVLDFDIQFGCTGLLLDTEPKSSVMDLIQSPERLDGTLLRGAMVRAHDRFDLLGPPPTVYPVDTIDPAAIIATIGTASHEYACTLIDLPLLWAHWTHAALRASSAIVLVVQLSVPSLRQGRRQLDMLRQEELDDVPVVVVANRVSGGFFSRGGVSLKAAEKALGRKVDHVVPDSPAIKAAAEAGVPLGEVSGGRGVEKKLVQIMEAIVHAAQPAAAAAKQSGG